jgi:uncharacterized protein (DUF2267 family)
MLSTAVDSLNQTFQKTHDWLTELAEGGSFHSEAQAYSALRAVLHELRDRLTVEEAAQLAAQLPMLVRGFYYEGWKPAATPTRIRSRQEFVGNIASRLGNSEISPERACFAVFQLLDLKISQGEINDVRHMLPAHIRELWPAPHDQE